MGGNDLIPGHPHCTKIVDSKQKVVKATNSHFLSYQHKGKPGLKPNHLIIHIQAYAAFSEHGGKSGKERISDAYGEFLQKGKSKGGSSNIFISVNNFPQPIRVEIPQSDMGNKSITPWTVIFIDVDKNVMESGRNALSKEAAEQLNPKIVEAINAINKKYVDDKGSKTSTPGVSKGIGGKGAKGTKTTTKPLVGSAKLPTTIPATTTPGKITPDTLLINQPNNEDEVELLFACLCQSGFIEGVKIFQKGNNQTTYDWTIKPYWEVNLMGNQQQKELSTYANKNRMKFKKSMTM